MTDQTDVIEYNQNTTLASVFQERVKRTPESIAYIQYRNGDWQQFTWQQTSQQVALWQAAMLKDGLKEGDRVAIMCGNAWEWVICDQAAQGLGLITVPIYTNDRSENIRWILEDSGASFLFVETKAQWLLAADNNPNISSLKRVICLSPLDTKLDNVKSIKEWIGEENSTYQRKQIDGDSLATIVYTSGTTGKPKGVMLSHRNILWNVAAVLQKFTIYPHDLLLSFLPLSHTLERTAGYYLPIITGTPVGYNRSIPQLADDLVALRPTIMISVPRIFERVYGKIIAQLDTASSFKKKLFEKAVNIGWHRFNVDQKRASWRFSLLLHRLLDHLVGKKIRNKLGGRLRFTVCGGAALSPKIGQLFIGLGVPIFQGYGLTETSPVIAANSMLDNEPFSVGTPLPDIEVQVDENSQLLTRSPSVMMGYWNNESATKELITNDGWLKTGDKVSIDKQGHIKITGRIKDIIVLSTGEKIPPSDMENAITLDELIEQVVIIGEAKPFLGALVVVNTERFEQLNNSLGLDAKASSSLKDKAVVKTYMRCIKQQISAFPGYAKIRQIVLLNDAWTTENGLMTPTLKLRRNEIMKRHQDDIDYLYRHH